MSAPIGPTYPSAELADALRQMDKELRILRERFAEFREEKDDRTAKLEHQVETMLRMLGGKS